ncbi:MAG TPA: hypothetical protein VGN01_01960 [Acidobacteriaceae bacterium]|jgi:hypothetical protein
MKQQKSVLMLALLAATIASVSAARAQDTHPTASRALQLSAFGGVAGVYTGLAGGKNFSVVAGADLGLPPWRGVRPTLEVRGLYPTDHGLVDSQKSILAGAKFEFLLSHRLRPYGDFLFGRGESNYGFGYLFNNNVYALTTNNVYSPGGGFDYDLTEHFAVRVDGQFQKWGSAPTPSGTIWSKVGMAGLVYRFNFDRRR